MVSGKRSQARAPIAALAMLLCAAAPAQMPAQSDPTAFYVSASGDDRNDGKSIDHAFRSLAFARQASRADPARKTIFLSGGFMLEEPFDLGPADAGSAWRATPGGTASVRAGPGVDFGFRLRRADGVTIAGLEFIGFRNSAIFGAESARLRVAGNVVRETASTGWSQAAIHLTGSVADAVITGNLIEGADYAGILVDTNATSDVSRLTIADNVVRRSCRKVHDCGAIYVNDRGRRSRGTVITGNTIADFGPPSVGGRGVYLDDWASGVTVEGNRISGPGRYAFQIHGGGDNLIRGNQVDMGDIDDAIFYQRLGDDPKSMAGNRIELNVFRFAYRGIRPLIEFAAGADRTHGPALIGNRTCVAKKPTVNTRLCRG